MSIMFSSSIYNDQHKREISSYSSDDYHDEVSLEQFNL